MLAGELYLATDPQLLDERARCDRLTRAFNEEPDPESRSVLLRTLLGSVGERVEVRPPFACDYGSQIHLGDDVFVNFGAVILDCAPVVLGDGCQVGPGVNISAADHPREPGLRRDGWEFSRPVTVGRNVWIGAGAILCPGVTVGDDSIIGAGSVVTGDIPAGVVAVGSPARVTRKL